MHEGNFVYVSVSVGSVTYPHDCLPQLQLFIQSHDFQVTLFVDYYIQCFCSLQIKELEHELEEVRMAAEKYEEDVSGASQDEDVELMDSQVSLVTTHVIWDHKYYSLHFVHVLSLRNKFSQNLNLI